MQPTLETIDSSTGTAIANLEWNGHFRSRTDGCRTTTCPNLVQTGTGSPKGTRRKCHYNVFLQGRTITTKHQERREGSRAQHHAACFWYLASQHHTGLFSHPSTNSSSSSGADWSLSLVSVTLCSHAPHSNDMAALHRRLPLTIAKLHALLARHYALEVDRQELRLAMPTTTCRSSTRSASQLREEERDEECVCQPQPTTHQSRDCTNRESEFVQREMDDT